MSEEVELYTDDLAHEYGAIRCARCWMWAAEETAVEEDDGWVGECCQQQVIEDRERKAFDEEDDR